MRLDSRAYKNWLVYPQITWIAANDNLTERGRTALQCMADWFDMLLGFKPRED